jgi:hypothetical protein
MKNKELIRKIGLEDQMHKAWLWFTNPENDAEIQDIALNCEASPTACPEHCTVEPDGICEHGYVSFFDLSIGKLDIDLMELALEDAIDEWFRN